MTYHEFLLYAWSIGIMLDSTDTFFFIEIAIILNFLLDI